MTYALLIAGLLLVAIAVRVAGGIVARRRGRVIPLMPTLLATVVLLVLTAVFDNLMIASGLVGYSDAHISGIRLGLAPIEDFAYPIAVAIMLPAIWELTRRRSDVEPS